VCLTNLFTRYPPMLPKLNRKRALFVLTKIDEILAWEKQTEAERDTRFVELGRYLCEVRAGQYWRLENLNSFDEFLERQFPESRRKGYYLMSIHEHLPAQARKDPKEVGWTKGLELTKVAHRDGQHFDCATWLDKARKPAGQAGMRMIRPQNRCLAAEPLVVRKSAPADIASRRLEMSVVRHDVKPGSPSQRIPQPVRRRFRAEPDNTLHCVPILRQGQVLRSTPRSSAAGPATVRKKV
jgi:hypothetical protein